MAARLVGLGRLGRNFMRLCLLSQKSTAPINCRYLHATQLQLGDVIKINMPSLSPTMEAGTILKWYKKEGDPVAPGDVLCDVQTDKAVVSFEIDEEGILAKILKEDNAKDIVVGTLIALMVEEGEDWQNVEVPAESAAPTPAASQPAVPPSVEPPPAAETPPPSSGHRYGYGPAVRAILDLYRLHTIEIPVTGPHGRLLKGDLLRYIQSKGLKPAPPPAVEITAVPLTPVPALSPVHVPVPLPITPLPSYPTPVAVESEGFVDIELSSMRKVIAQRLTESKTTIPHLCATAECNVAEVLKLRKQLAEEGVKVSMNDFIIKAAAVALQRVPEANAIWAGEAPRVLRDIDISVAVATDAGLITPIVKDAISIGLEEISSAVRDLATRARAGRLQLHEFQGGSFTISNLGMFGISEFSAVINPPQAAILAIGGNRQELDLEGQTQTLMTVTLSADARILDDALAMRFVQVFKEVMETPMLMLSQGKPVQIEELKENQHLSVDLEKLFAK